VNSKEKAGTIFFTYFTTKLIIVLFKNGNISPILVTTICFIDVSLIISSRFAQKFSKIIIAFAPESLN